MRIRLMPGKQRELIEEIKLRGNLRWLELARILGVNKNTLIDWRLEKKLLPYKIFKKLDKNSKFRKYILEVRKNNWGQVRGGTKSSGSTLDIKIPYRDEKFSEFIGILLGDGNIFSYKKGKKVSVHMVRIAGDYRKDHDYLTNFVLPLSEDLFGIRARLYKQKNTNGFYVILHSIKLIEFLLKEGFKPGNKIKNQLTIPKWIWKDERFLKACVRGLMDTDGSLYELTPRWPGLFQLNFKNSNSRLLKDTRRALLELGFDVSKISKGNSIYITKKSEIKKFYKDIGSKNLRHIAKYEKIIAPHSPVEEISAECSGQTFVS